MLLPVARCLTATLPNREKTFPTRRYHVTVSSARSNAHISARGDSDLPSVLSTISSHILLSD